jgi:hypothetical protein
MLKRTSLGAVSVLGRCTLRRWIDRHRMTRSNVILASNAPNR